MEVTAADGSKRRVSASKGIVIATGSSTIQVPGFEFDGEHVIGAREAVSLREIPKRMVVVGGGVIGLELGMVYQSFGTELTVVELTPHLLPGIDPDCVKVVERSLVKHGGKVLKNTRAERVEKRADGVVAITASENGKEGEVAAEVIAGHKSAKDWTTVPGVVFTHPEIATAGLSEAQAKEEGYDVKVGKFPFAALGRAMSIAETDGFVKVVRDLGSNRVLGVSIVGPSASDLISEAALAVEMVASVEDLALTIHPHPTLGEALMEASAASLGHAIHIVNR